MVRRRILLQAALSVLAVSWQLGILQARADQVDSKLESLGTYRLPSIAEEEAAIPPDQSIATNIELLGFSGIQLGDSQLSPCDCQQCRAKPFEKTIRVNGFFQADAIWFEQDAANIAVVGDAQDVADFRRARLSVAGEVAENVKYFMEYDFAFPGRPSFMDVYLDMDELAGLGRVRIGHWRQPFGMGALTSVKDLVFLERALPFSLLPFRQIGVGLYNTARDDTFTWAISGYRFRTDVFGNVAGDAGYGMSTRETVLLIEGEEGTLHLGGGYTYNRPDTSTIRLRSPPEVGYNELDFHSTNLPVPFFIDSGALATDFYQLFNLELAGSYGSWLAQAEYYFANVGLTTGGEAAFEGAYAQLSYVLTGESHTYNKKGGVYERVRPDSPYGRCGSGAWEIAGRWSFIDLQDGAIDGGRIDDLTFGLNWYLNNFTKFQFNYIHAFLDRPLGSESNANVFALRAQLDF